MNSKLIILRGNSGSGKTTTAKLLQEQFRRGQAMVISQDVVRIDLLYAKDRVDNPTVELIKRIAEFGKERGYEYVIIEGIFNSEIYREMFVELTVLFAPHVYPYYYAIPFEETVRRHQTRAKANDFGPGRMKDWWLEKDYLHIENEKKLDETLSQEEIVRQILIDIVK